MTKFLVFSDLHYDHVFDAEKRLQMITKAVEDSGVDFAIALGDICTPVKENEIVREQLLNMKVPFYRVTGNHDIEMCSQQQEASFWGRERQYESFAIGDVKYIILDSNYYRRGERELPYQCNKYNKQTDVYPLISKGQVQWLIEEMTNPEMKYVIFSHHSLVNQFGNRGVDNQAEIREILEQRKTLLAMNGHDHGDNVNVVNGIPYFTVNASSYVWHGLKPVYCYSEEIHKQYPYLSKMILYKTAMWCIVEIDGDKVCITGMENDYQTATPEDVGITGRTWNGVSIEPRIVSWKN